MNKQDAISRFWNERGKQLPPGTDCFVSNEKLIPCNVSNSVGKIIEPNSFDVAGFLFFIDFAPEDDWAHSCSYLFLDPSGKLNDETVFSNGYGWPPHKDIALEKINKPAEYEDV